MLARKINILFIILFLILSSTAWAIGPKKTIMVGSIENKAGASSQFAIGNALEDMLTESLQKTGQFIITERPQLQAGLAEQDFAQSGRTSVVGRPQLGKITNAQIMITGAVSEFDPSSSGNRAGLNIKGFGAGVSQATAYLAVVIRIIDMTTMQVLDSQRVEGYAKAGGANFSYQGGNIGGNIGGFRKTPIGKACQEAINQAVAYITDRLQNVFGQGAIAAIDQYGIIINIGGESGVKTGDKFNVLKKGSEIIDPTTGVSLGTREQWTGTIEIVSVDPKFATARSISGNNFAIGDSIQPIQ
ncbi:hypothetical protein IIB34_03425 [PVC group bacterium]|nr:hypothetical protein [PVC group bacterium]